MIFLVLMPIITESIPASLQSGQQQGDVRQHTLRLRQQGRCLLRYTDVGVFADVTLTEDREYVDIGELEPGATPLLEPVTTGGTCEWRYPHQSSRLLTELNLSPAGEDAVAGQFTREVPGW